ncbi:hypothetical protein CLOM_g3603, partial [Closterium sp. NIES-68]
LIYNGASNCDDFVQPGRQCGESEPTLSEAAYSNEASHIEPEARRWAAVTPQDPETAPQAAEIALHGKKQQQQQQQQQQGRMQQQQGRMQQRAHREAPVCAADLTELLTAILGILPGASPDMTQSDAVSDRPCKSSWFWRLISDEEEEEGEGEGRPGKAGSGRFGSPAGVLEYIGFDDDDDDDSDDDEDGDAW